MWKDWNPLGVGSWFKDTWILCAINVCNVQHTRCRNIIQYALGNCVKHGHASARSPPLSLSLSLFMPQSRSCSCSRTWPFTVQSLASCCLRELWNSPGSPRVHFSSLPSPCISLWPCRYNISPRTPSIPVRRVSGILNWKLHYPFLSLRNTNLSWKCQKTRNNIKINTWLLSHLSLSNCVSFLCKLL